MSASPETIDEWPTYTQSEVAALIVDAGADEGTDQWVKYSHNVAISGGSAPYSVTSITGLPTGLSAALSDDGSAINITGVPEENGVFTITVNVEDRESVTANDSYDLTLSAADRIPVVESTYSSEAIDVGCLSVLNGYNFGDTVGTLYTITPLEDPPQDPLPTPVGIPAYVSLRGNTEIQFTLPAGTYGAEMELYLTA